MLETCKPAKFCLLVVGRLEGVSRKRLRAVVEQVGGELTPAPKPGVNLVALAHRSASALLSGAPPIPVPPELTPAVPIISETTLKRMLGLAPRSAGERTLDRSDVLRASKLSPELLACAEAYDVVEPVDGRYSYRDVMIAREVRRLLDGGFSLSTIVEASLKLRRSRLALSEVRVAEAPWGEVLQETCAGLASLEGQLVLPLGHDDLDGDDLFARAEVAEASGDLSAAERLYRRVLAMDRSDAAIPYNLGNVLDAQGRRGEAVAAYYEALQRDGQFAEAWFNLGVMAEEEGRAAHAVAHYRAAVSAQPNFSDAVFNLALLLTEHEVYDEAGRLWERFIALRPHGTEAARARRYATLCRIARRSREPPLAARESGARAQPARH